VARLVINGADTALGQSIRAVAQATTGHDIVAGDSPDDLRAGDRVVMLAARRGDEVDGTTVGGVDLAGTARWLDAAASARPDSIVVLSSAMVYGAWADNPVPLTEDARLRPNPGCRFAVAKAELERLAAEFRREAPDVAVSVLRPTLTVRSDSGAVEWLERSLWHTPTIQNGHADPPRQFLHLDDLAAAVVVALESRFTGAANVAPEGWLAAPSQLALAGKSGTLRVPEGAAGGVADMRWRFQLTSTPPDVVPYTMYPWVVASDRMRSLGWTPQFTNEEAFVVGHRETWWSSLSARQRQEVSLGAMVGGLVAIGGGVGAVVRRAAQRSSRANRAG